MFWQPSLTRTSQKLEYYYSKSYYTLQRKELDKQLDQKYSLERTPLPRHIEIGTVSFCRYYR